jgi:hypothetical protein
MAGDSIESLPCHCVFFKVGCPKENVSGKFRGVNNVR